MARDKDIGKQRENERSKTKRKCNKKNQWKKARKELRTK